MKSHSNEFKEEIKMIGKQQSVRITYTLNNEQIILTDEDINSATPNYEANLLKSVMKVLELNSNISIPKDTEIKFEYGLLVNGAYEYLDYGNYIVAKEPEKQEDTLSYKITCYDKMLYSMKDYEHIDIPYPCTIKQYLVALCNKIGLQFKDSDFANADRQITNELFMTINEDGTYSSMGYTYRDVLDQIAETTGGCICITLDDKVEVRYINETNDTIDEEYINDVNVNFGEKYGPINSIVLARAGESDKIYKKDQNNINENGLCELMISENQFMNFNNRVDYLQELSEKLFGVEYYLNDFVSTGIMYYDLLDMYNIEIFGKTYNCLMINDEQNITQGLEENIHTDRPEKSETDYTKADKTDRRLNQTYLIVDKQNKKIESVVSETTKQNEKISQITQTVDELNSKISDIADITVSDTSIIAKLILNDINECEPIRVVVRPIVDYISYLYPSNSLFPSSSLKIRTRYIKFNNTKTGEIVLYEIPDNLYYYNDEISDEFVLDYDTKTCLIIKRVGIDKDGKAYLLENERTIEYEYPKIELTRGDYEISIVGYNSAYLFVRLMATNIYTTQFATKVELESKITQTKSEIDAEVKQKVNEEEIIAKLNLAVKDGQGVINISGNQVTIDSDNFKLDADGTITAKKGAIAGLIMERDSNKSSRLSKNYNNGGSTYQSGIYVPDTTNGNDVFLYAGASDDIKNAPARITHNGDAYFRNINLNAQSGSCSIDYDSGNKAIDFYTNGISFRLDDEKNNQFGSLFKDGAAGGFFMNMLSAKFFGFIDLLHPAYQPIFYIYRFEPNDNQNHEVRSYADIKVWGNRFSDGVNNSIYIQGYEVATNASDERLKENKEVCKENALEILKNIEMISFDWKNDTHTRDAGKHIPIGYGAQRTKKVYENAVIYNEENDTYQMDLLNLSALHTKAIQELNKKIEKRDKIIEFLAEKLNCKDEVLEMLKEGE